MTLYGTAYKINIINYNTNKETQEFSRNCDFIQALLFTDKHLNKLPDTVRGLYSNYSVLYYVLKREGKLEEYGIEADELSISVLEKMTETLMINLEMLNSNDLPLVK